MTFSAVPETQDATTGDALTVGEAALRLHHAVGFAPSVAARLAAAGFDVTGFMAVRVVDAEVAS